MFSPSPNFHHSAHPLFSSLFLVFFLSAHFLSVYIYHIFYPRYVFSFSKFPPLCSSSFLFLFLYYCLYTSYQLTELFFFLSSPISHCLSSALLFPFFLYFFVCTLVFLLVLLSAYILLFPLRSHYSLLIFLVFLLVFFTPFPSSLSAYMFFILFLTLFLPPFFLPLPILSFLSFFVLC